MMLGLSPITVFVWGPIVMCVASILIGFTSIIGTADYCGSRKSLFIVKCYIIAGQVLGIYLVTQFLEASGHFVPLPNASDGIAYIVSAYAINWVVPNFLGGASVKILLPEKWQRAEQFSKESQQRRKVSLDEPIQRGGGPQVHHRRLLRRAGLFAFIVVPILAVVFVLVPKSAKKYVLLVETPVVAAGLLELVVAIYRNRRKLKQANRAPDPDGRIANDENRMGS